MKHKLQQLNSKQASFLLTLLTLEGEKDLQLLRYFPEQSQQLILQSGQDICQQSRKEFLPSVVKELKGLLKKSSQSIFETLEPEWIAEILQHESPAVLRVILHNLSKTVRERIIQKLPSARTVLSKSPVNKTHPDILQVIFENLQKKAPKLNVGLPSELCPETLSFMQKQEILTLIRELGMVETAIAFQNLGVGAISELCRRLSENEVDKVLQIIATGVDGDIDRSYRAQTLIRELSTQAQSKREFMELLGLQLLKNSVDFEEVSSSDFAYKLPQKLGKVFLSKDFFHLQSDEYIALKVHVIQTTQRLAAEGAINSGWAHIPARNYQIEENVGHEE